MTERDWCTVCEIKLKRIRFKREKLLCLFLQSCVHDCISKKVFEIISMESIAVLRALECHCLKIVDNVLKNKFNFLIDCPLKEIVLWYKIVWTKPVSYPINKTMLQLSNIVRIPFVFWRLSQTQNKVVFFKYEQKCFVTGKNMQQILFNKFKNQVTQSLRVVARMN